MTAPASPSVDAPHIPVLLGPILEHLYPFDGVWLDGTFGAGGYSRAMLDAGAGCIIGVDRDPAVIEMAQDWALDYGDKLKLVPGVFSELDQHAGEPLDGVVLDLGVSSMQLDQAERGFSFLRDGPLDMRMGQHGLSAADIVNTADEEVLANILFNYGEERASRRIARTIVKARPLTTTAELADVVSSCLPRAKPGQSHPATRSFQAIRIAVNDELGELVSGLEAAERALKPGGALAVVSFHSIEDRIVKRYLSQAANKGGGGNRYAPETAVAQPRFKLEKAISPSKEELVQNPRARSARLRIAYRTDAPAGSADRSGLGLPGGDAFVAQLKKAGV
jgi:16S rRNA (cytosine1402-N4)-methyltransferase